MSAFSPFAGLLTHARRQTLLAVLFASSLAAIAPGARTASLPQGSTPALSSTVVEEAVRSYLDEWHPLKDPLTTLGDGVQVKSSNFYGVQIEGERYYYRPRYQFSADPVSRGAARDYQVVIVLDADTGFETEIYRLSR